MKTTLSQSGALLASVLISHSAIAAESPFDFEALLQLDADFYGEIYNRSAKNNNREYEVRRARFGLSYQRDDWESSLSAQYKERDNDLVVHDAYVKYKGFDKVKFTIGKFKEPMGMERLSGAANTAGIERSMVSTAFAPGRAFGLQAHKTKKYRSWSFGIFQEHDTDNRYNGRAPRAATGRFSFAPYHKKKSTLHVGLSASYRDWNKQAFRIRERGEINTADNIIRSASFDADEQLLAALEAAYSYKALLLQSEYFYTKLNPKGLSNSFTYSGFYIQAEYNLSGERRKYKNSKFSRLKPHANWGAVEIVTRYSELDLRDKGLGARASSYMIGLNYQWQRDIRLMLNILHPEISGNTLHNIDEGDAIAIRLQYKL